MIKIWLFVFDCFDVVVCLLDYWVCYFVWGFVCYWLLLGFAIAGCGCCVFCLLFVCGVLIRAFLGYLLICVLFINLLL